MNRSAFYLGLKRSLQHEMSLLKPVSRTGRIQATAIVGYECVAVLPCLWTRKRRFFASASGGSVQRYIDLVLADPRDLANIEGFDESWKLVRGRCKKGERIEDTVQKWDILLVPPINLSQPSVAVLEVEHGGVS